MYKSGICDTKPAVSLKPKFVQSVYRNSCTAYRLVTLCELWPTFPESKIFPQGISPHFLSEHDEIWQHWGLANDNLFPKIRECWTGDPVTKCGDMRQSFTNAFVKWYSTTSPCLPIVLNLFLFTALPED